MKREEAIKILQPIGEQYCQIANITLAPRMDEIVEAIDMAIESLKQPEIVRCGECAYYDPPHVENNGVRYEYTEMPEEAFDVLGTGLVTTEYGINIGGRCTRDYNTRYDDDKRVYVPENNFCGRAERRTDENNNLFV